MNSLNAERRPEKAIEAANKAFSKTNSGGNYTRPSVVALCIALGGEYK